MKKKILIIVLVVIILIPISLKLNIVIQNNKYDKELLDTVRKQKEEIETSDWYENIAEKLKENLNKNAWDGKWYKRAFADNGDIYGSMENEECRIDSIAQSWSVISGAGDEEEQKQAMESLENHLVDVEVVM